MQLFTGEESGELFLRHNCYALLAGSLFITKNQSSTAFRKSLVSFRVSFSLKNIVYGH